MIRYRTLLPDKAIDLIDESSSRVRLYGVRKVGDMRAKSLKSCAKSVKNVTRQ